MYFEVTRQALMTPLKMIAGVVERKQVTPILGHILVKIQQQQLSLTATDNEIELKYHMSIEAGEDGEMTIPALKLYDICRALNKEATITVKQKEQRAMLTSGRGRFALMTLPAGDFPNSDSLIADLEFSVTQNTLRYLLNKTQFAVAQQDARPALNGLLIEIQDNKLNFVATDGHRMAFATEVFSILSAEQKTRILLPRKMVMELLKILNDSEEMVKIRLNQQQVCFELPELRLTSRLIDRPYPDYEVILANQATAKIAINGQQFKQALQRVAILYDEKFKGVRLAFAQNLLTISASNPEHEQASDELDIVYNGEDFEVGFNVVYLLDALACIDTAEVELHLSGASGSCFVCPKDKENPKYVIMPMRL